MLINEVSKLANLTKKAIEYYCKLEFVVPRVLENGYRDFLPDDIERFKQVGILRKLGLSTQETKDVLTVKPVVLYKGYLCKISSIYR